ncbi:MAG TPA: beta-ribofuranosylaminobenzene 5'-phosphate synthase family protein [Pseudolabrys sp.]|nr:beta-ribofuranosylaminobenzene 5'-phosphate synthase family protein [Pseudolabrys sp.]
MTVSVPARLHFGFLDLNGGVGRRFGSIGLSISELRTCIKIARATETQVRGPDSQRARGHLDSMRDFLGIDGDYRVDVLEAVPSHSGLGSGTLLALAIAAGIRRLHGLPLDIRADALRLGRGSRSGVGIGLFESGGLVVDGGHGARPGAAPIISHMPFPETWRIVLILDPARAGLHGKDETAAFDKLPPFPAADAAQICRLVLMQTLPAVAEGDLVTFAGAIKRMQALLGAYFAPLQGGRSFASAEIAAALQLLEGEGAVGIGQSSWGPTGFAFAGSDAEAMRLAEFARKHPRCRGLEIRICKGLNRGAEITAGAAAVATHS